MFKLSPGADKKMIAVASRQLTADLAEALELCITQHVQSIREETPFPKAEASYNPAVYSQPNEILATAGYPGEQEYRVNGEKLVYLRLFPTHSGQPSVGLTKLTHVFQTRRPCPMSMAIGGVPSRNRWGPVIYDPGVSTQTIVGVTQGFATGELWGVNTQMFSPRGRHNVSGAELWVAGPLALKNFTFVPCAITSKLHHPNLALSCPIQSKSELSEPTVSI
jgi:hypothetical protein